MAGALLALLLAPAVAAPVCATPAVWSRALAGRPPLAVLRGPAMSAAGPPPPSKTVYGSHFSHHHDTANFSLNWEDGAVSDAAVALAAEALEQAWTALVVDQGWPAPVSSDAWLLWVVLDPALAGTGLTNEYTTAAYPDGYPVIWIDPDGLAEFGAPFYRSLVIHEFMHAVQFALRPSAWELGEPAQAWYWEAAATHAPELVDPAIDGHQYTSAWYASAADQRFDTLDSAHEYGMFVLNAHLEDQVLGPGGMQAVWERSADAGDALWDEILADASGMEAGALFAGFAGAHGNAQLPESARYTLPPAPALVLPQSGRADTLGARYYTATAAVSVALSDDSAGAALLAGPDGVAPVVRLAAGEVVAVTALADGTDFTLVAAALEAPGDTGDGPDTGDAAAAAEDGPAGDAGATGAAPEKAGCAVGGAAVGGAAGPGLGLLALVPVVGRRRRPGPSAAPGAPG